MCRRVRAVLKNTSGTDHEAQDPSKYGGSFVSTQVLAISKFRQRNTQCLHLGWLMGHE